MYSISIYDTQLLRGKKLEKLIECYFSAKRLPFRIRKFSTMSDIIRIAGYTDILFANIDEHNKDIIDMSAALMERYSNIHLYILSDKYTFLDDVMDLRAFRYFSNPVDRERLFSSLDIITQNPKKLSFVSDYTPITLVENEIVCIYTASRRTYVLTDSGATYPTTLSIKEWLSKTQGFRNYASPHYSYIVNTNYVWDFSSELIILKCKTGKVMKIYPSQRKIGEFRNVYNSRR